MMTLGQFPVDFILPLIGIGKHKLKLSTKRGTVEVKVNSSRLECLKRNQQCVVCGIKGNIFLLQTSWQNPPTLGMNCFIEDCQWCVHRTVQRKMGWQNPHLNLYCRFRNGKTILMTQDNIIPKSRGGSNKIMNLQTMCTYCNNKKGNSI